MHAHMDVHVWKREEAAKNIFVILLEKYCADLDLSLAPKKKNLELVGFIQTENVVFKCRKTTFQLCNSLDVHILAPASG